MVADCNRNPKFCQEGLAPVLNSMPRERIQAGAEEFRRVVIAEK